MIYLHLFAWPFLLPVIFHLLMLLIAGRIDGESRLVPMGPRGTRYTTIKYWNKK